jgi:hypothetical protein
VSRDISGCERRNMIGETAAVSVSVGRSEMVRVFSDTTNQQHSKSPTAMIDTEIGVSLGG